MADKSALDKARDLDNALRAVYYLEQAAALLAMVKHLDEDLQEQVDRAHGLTCEAKCSANFVAINLEYAR